MDKEPNTNNPPPASNEIPGIVKTNTETNQTEETVNTEPNLFQRLSDDNVMPDGMLPAVTETQYTNLIISSNAVEEKQESEKKQKP